MNVTGDAAAPLGERIAAQVGALIVQGRFAPGQRLVEAALADELAVSRNTLREAFRLLAREGLLEHAPNRGVCVAVPSVATIVDIYRVRRMIECRALAEAPPRHPAGTRMREALRAAEALLERGDWRGVGTANMAFHRAVVELADSERLLGLFDRLLIELRLAFGLLDDPEHLHAPYVALNAAILDRFEAERFAEAAAALRDYLLRSEQVVLSAYARRDAAPHRAGR